MSNNKHTIKFKLSLVQRLEAGEDLSQLAKEAAISEAVLRKWRGEYRRGDGWSEGEMKRQLKEQKATINKLERDVQILKKASAYFSEQTHSKRDMCLFIDQNRKEYQVKELCVALQVGPSTYYDHRQRQTGQVISKQQQETYSLALLVKAIFIEKKGTIGA